MNDILQGNVTILPGGISEDHRDSMIVNYTRTNGLFFRTIRDELRRVRSPFRVSHNVHYFRALHTYVHHTQLYFAESKLEGHFCLVIY